MTEQERASRAPAAGSALHVMVDLETMGDGPTASITQIGAVAFDLEAGGVWSEFSADVSLASSAEAGLQINPHTIAWWMEQEGAAREEWLRGQAQAKPLRAALGQFIDWLRPLKAEGIWSHGATFDLPILHNACRVVGRNAGWGFRFARDTRTLFWLCAPFDPWIEQAHEGEVKHRAVDDARRQARAVLRAVAYLRASAASLPEGQPQKPQEPELKP